jgi:uncharacterized protein
MDSAWRSTETPFWTWRDLLAAVMLAIPMFIAAAGITYFALKAVPGDKPRALMLLVPQFVGFAAAVVPLVLILRVRHDQPLWEGLRLRLPSGEWYRSILSGVGLAFLVLTTALLVRPPRIESPLEELMTDPASAPFIAIAAITAAPIFEELFFRGLLQPLLVRDLGVLIGVVLSALPFAMLHGPEYSWSWRHLLLIAVAGIGFAWKRQTTGSLGAAMITHAAYNAVITSGHILGRNLVDG